jgi:nickel transport protein
MKFIKKIQCISLITMMLLPTLSQAHGIWFAQRSTQLALIYGIGADDLDSVKRQHKIESIVGFDTDWEEVDAQLTVAGPLLLVTSDDYPTAVAAVMNNGIWSNTGEGHWVGKGRDELPDAIVSEKTIKYAVHLRGPLRAIPPIESQTLQILPMGKEFPLLLGNKVTFKVVLAGKPVQGAKITADFVNDPDAEPVISDKDGLFTIPIRNQGLNVIAAIVDGPSDNVKVIDKIEHLATLSFVLPHEPE